MTASTGDDATLPGELGSAPGSTAHEGWLLPGAPIGRYTVLSRLGAGGMGVVYAAFDTELDRKVALKLLRPGPGTFSSSRDHEHRLLKQEAQALAKLAHPNVITIHDVGEHEGRVFLAMEFVDGQTLGQWLDEPRGWREILAMFLFAGEGLRAAHEQGLVHRDFKPDNVMVGKDGRVRVMDFGLARSVVVLERSSEGAGLVGTPAYMAPEQLSGLALDERSDQFSFCVTLWEALHGVRPFAGDDVVELFHSITDAQPQLGSRRGTPPSWLRRVLLTGLAADPGRRFPAMDALLHALRRDPSRKRRRVLGLASLVALAGASWGAVAWADARTIAACEQAGRAIEEEWNPARRREIEQAMLASAVAFAPETWSRVEPRLDRYAAEWAAAREAGCRAVEVEQRWSESLAQRADECLRERRAAFGSLLGVLSSVTLEELLLLNASVSSLPTLEACIDEDELSRRPSPRTDERERRMQLRDELARAAVEWRAGRQQAGQARLEAALAEATALDDLELEARAEAELGALFGTRGDHGRGAEHLRRAYFELGRVGDEDRQTSLAIELAAVEAGHLGRRDVAETWLEHAGMLQARVHGSTADEPFALTRARATWLAAGGDYEGAIELARLALARAEGALGIDHPEVDAIASTVADIESRRGHYDEALEVTLAALARQRRTWGDHHPEVARWLINVAILQSIRGELETAESYAREAVELTESSLGPDHPRTADALRALAVAQSKRGELAAAIVAYERALAVYERHETNEALDIRTSLGGLLVQHGEHARAVKLLEAVLEALRARVGPDSPELLNVLINLGAAQRGLGDLDAAASSYGEAIRVGEATLEHDHPTLAYPLNNLGTLELARGNPDEARRLLSRALEIRRAKLGNAHPLVASTLDALALVDLDQRRTDDAIARLEEARTIMLGKGADPRRRAEIELHLDQALRDGHREPLTPP